MHLQACSLSFLAVQAFIISEGAHTRSFLQPDAASRLFHQVAGKWIEEANIALKDSTADAEQLGHMKSACIKVANAFVGAANGDETKAVEYMDNVCYKTDDEICKEFGRRIADQVRSADQSNMDSFCEAFWHGPLKDKAMGKSVAPVSASSDSSSPLKALPRYTQSATKPSEHGSSKKNSKEEIHEVAAKIAAEAVAKKSPVHQKGKASAAPIAAKKLSKTVPNTDAEAEKRIKNATGAALKAAQQAAQASFEGKNSTKVDHKAKNAKNTKNAKSQVTSTKGIDHRKGKGAKKPKALVTSGSTTGTMVTDAALEHAEHAAEVQAQKTAAAAAAAAKAAAEDAATASANTGSLGSDAELERVADKAEAEAQRTANAAATAKKQADVDRAALHATTSS
eukprot:gnl/MRDRNA2_/MRDRNA2_91399_c0_seq1.p1 gnl/MRDRNA2_/MRDRNA2_91399_c0~~gnl/MRDRNA2_/MRDRNA2_91399_c0_seq1.p1  ORF type:complete len:396 (+),score=118.41 gnl/MRDRNA2_/MRDRNA2_91399_c0_seq1:74-1261(+)